MKKTLLFLFAAGCLVLPALSHADSDGIGNGKKTAKFVAPAASSQGANSRKVIYYITNAPRTGSAIPMVYRGYNNRIDSASNAAVYGQTSIDAAGTLDVGTTLTKLDSSISFRR